jgi:hypothetical protein
MESDDDSSYSPAPSSSPPATAEHDLPLHSATNTKDGGSDINNTYFTRPNRYFGPDSTWLSWTESDRLAAQLLDQERAANLGLHLVQAHRLKRKAERDEEEARRDRKGKRRAVERQDEDKDGEGRKMKVAVKLPGRWDAWPLAVGEVPREDDYGGRGGSETQWPSRRLEECLVAATTRLARERWRSREWESAQAKAGGITSAIVSGQMANMKALQESDVSDAAETLNSDSNSESDSPPKQGNGAPMAYSQTYLAEGLDIEQHHGLDRMAEKWDIDEEEDEDQTPTPIADDVEARALLLPGIRQTTSKLDDLLIALHKARQAYAPSKRRGRAGSESSDMDEDAHISQSRSRSRSQARKRARSMSRDSESSVGSRRSNASEEPAKRLGMRDWSDVVGMAALTGWHPDVVQRASERCARLFDGNMIFRTFHEGNSKANEPPYYDELYAIQPVDKAPEDDEDEDTGLLMRSSAACDACTKQRRKCEPTGSQATQGSCKACLERGEECSSVQGRPAPKGLRCPFRFCERRHIPFNKRWKLQRHLDTVHNEHRPPPSSSPARSSASEGYLGSDDPPVCPVETCARHETPFKEGGKLYRHLRKMHPEVDVAEVKRLEVVRRGERRGRWRDESRRREVSKRNRSKSAGMPSSPLVQSAQDVIEID